MLENVTQSEPLEGRYKWIKILDSPLWETLRFTDPTEARPAHQAVPVIRSNIPSSVPKSWDKTRTLHFHGVVHLQSSR